MKACNIATVDGRVDAPHSAFFYGSNQILAGRLASTAWLESPITEKIPHLEFDVVLWGEGRRSTTGEPLIKGVKRAHFTQIGGPP